MSRFCLRAGVLPAAWLLAAAALTQEPSSQPASQPTSEPAQAESAPAPPAEQPPPRFKSLLDLKELTFDLGVEGRADRREVAFKTNERWPEWYRQTNRAFRLDETVGMRSSGAILDERIALFNVAARWGLTQDSYDESAPGIDRHQHPNGNLLEYDLNLTLLPRGTLSGNVFAQRLDSRVPRTFLPSLDRTLERYGADLFVNDRTFPMRFSFEHVWDTLTSRTHNLNDDEQRGRDTFRYEGTWQMSEQQSLRLEYQYDDRHERYSGTRTSFDTTRHDLLLNHTLRFGPEGRSSWETLARIQEESGDLARDIGEVSTRLRLQHTDTLASNFGAQYLHESFQQLATDTTRLEGGLTYELAKALTTSLQLYGFEQHANENADFLEWGSLASAAYSQDNTLGRFSANLSYNHAATDTRSGTQRGIVIGESVTFHDPLPAYLAKTDVDTLSVVVTDANRARTYLAGRDYFVVKLGRYTSLHRVPTGHVADAETVLVSYTYKVSQDYDVRRDRVDLRLQQDFKFGLTPYYAASLQWEDLDRPRYLTFQARDINRQRLGATYRRPRWSAGVEYEYNDDSIDPYQAVHANGDVVLWQSARQQLDGKATASRFWFRGAADLASHDTTLMDLGLSHRYLLAEQLEANTSALYRYENDTLNGITHGVDLTTALEWKIGYFSLRLEAEYDVLNLPDSRDNSFSVWLKLKRDIPVIRRAE